MVFGGLAVFFVFQVLFPLRHLLYPGDVAWTEQGHPFSWRMKLRSKEGTVVFRVSDPVSQRTLEVSRTLAAWQWEEMACRPDMILQYAHHLAEQRRIEGTKGVEVRADVWCALNGRRFARLVDPARDLAAVDRSLAAADWILPLNEPLPALASGR